MFFKKISLLATCCFIISFSFAQKEISVKAIWQDYTFYDEYLPSFNFRNDGKSYSILDENRIKQCDIKTGLVTEVVFDAVEANHPEFNGRIDDYTFSKDESKILLKTETEQIYRRSSKSNFYVWDRKQKKLHAVSTSGKQRYATFSPKGDKVAFVRGNNLFYKDLDTGKEVQITFDGKHNEIINGASDWVYEEEFRLTRAFEWSPDGKKIAFLRFDETRVKEFTMQLFRGGLYPENVTFKYPKVGEENAKVDVLVYDLDDKKTKQLEVETGPDVYIPKLLWTKKENAFCFFRLNRHQNELEILIADTETKQVEILLKETNRYYLSIDNHLTFLEDGNYFLLTSEQDGFNHIYLYTMDGELKKQLTKGDFEVTDIYGFDEKRKRLYFQAAMDSPLERQVYQVNLKGEKLKKITPEQGTNQAQFSSNFDYFVNTHSSANTPPKFIVFNHKCLKIRVIEDNNSVVQLQNKYGVQPVEFFNFETPDSVQLNAWQIKPPNFDPQKKYPVLMYVYGGPGSQRVIDKYGGQNYWWFQMLAQKGYIVVCVDNRGTGGRGEAFQKSTYLQLGKYETIDQIEAAKYLSTLPFVDANRIGIFGWSYGGYVSLLSLFKGAEVFKSAIAVAPVANWKWYDSVYTERYMQTFEENPDGYDDNAPINFVDKMKGNLLLIHGMGDDNVHFQNTVELTNALIRADKQFETYFYPNRNHSIFGSNARHHLYVKMTNFLLEKL